MSLDRKDVRSKISAEAHEHLVAMAEFHEKDICEYSSLLLERALLGEAHVIKLTAERFARLGKPGQPRGEGAAAAGRSGKTKLHGV